MHLIFNYTIYTPTYSNIHTHRSPPPATIHRQPPGPPPGATSSGSSTSNLNKGSQPPSTRPLSSSPCAAVAVLRRQSRRRLARPAKGHGRRQPATTILTTVEHHHTRPKSKPQTPIGKNLIFITHLFKFHQINHVKLTNQRGESRLRPYRVHSELRPPVSMEIHRILVGLVPPPPVLFYSSRSRPATHWLLLFVLGRSPLPWARRCRRSVSSSTRSRSGD
ncbi:hypothetical protein Dimus_039658 [Dionaea muscipula]